MTTHITKNTPIHPSAPVDPTLPEQRPPTDRPLGRYCGHVFLYWDPEYFHHAARHSDSKMINPQRLTR